MSKGKGKPRFLRLQVRVVRKPKGVTADQVKKVLLAGIARGGYEIPKGWVVQLGWSNHKDKALKWDEWTNAMVDSSTGGRGWDTIVSEHIRNMR